MRVDLYVHFIEKGTDLSLEENVVGLRICISETLLLPGRGSGDPNSSLLTWENHSFLSPL